MTATDINDFRESSLTLALSDVNITDLHRYREGLLTLLSTVVLDEQGLAFAESIKAVYDLLGHLSVDPDAPVDPEAIWL